MATYDPPHDCAQCPRLAKFRRQNREAHPGFHNGPVPAFGALEARLLIVGLAPGLHGANRTGRPFTGDHAGDLLYGTIAELGLSVGQYDRRADDLYALTGCRVTNAVRCVPPANKPTPDEVKTCRQYLEVELATMPNLRGIVALGQIAHRAVISAHGRKQKEFPFRHGAIHDLGAGRFLADSYHCSRYNTNTGRLTPTMFYSMLDTATRRAELR
ncbi:MAG: uracil-DNA glycosylase [Alphaproteobacteria bacterium]|nr:uracil-DNA glycosylase [Alphaproteobacteria bacterium]